MKTFTLSPDQPYVLADALLSRPSRSERRVPALATDAVLITLCSLFIAACARISIPLSFTLVPITGQTFAVLLTGMLLGSRRGALALLLYLAEGAAGLPVFAGGAAGATRFLGPTGGYLIAYPLAAALVGFLAERGGDRRPLAAALTLLVGSLVILSLGTLWLSFFVGGLGSAFLQGFLPFIPGDLVKSALAALLLPGGWRLVRRLRTE